jgi:HigB_toxin, RelE-like toxic component of a toxin-antitoxin system
MVSSVTVIASGQRNMPFRGLSLQSLVAHTRSRRKSITTRERPGSRASCFPIWEVDVVAAYSKASSINAERCVFDICGGNYRLIVAFKFSARVAFIKFIGTHTQYDRVSSATVSQF